jgi:hypothetical protein
LVSNELKSLALQPNPSGSELEAELARFDEEFVLEDELEEYGWTGARKTCEHIILAGWSNQCTLKDVPRKDIATEPNIISPRLL